MQKIEIRERCLPSGYHMKAFFIDERPLSAYLEEWIVGNEALEYLSPCEGLEICWTDEYDYEGDARFMRFVLNQQDAITPILSCPDDMDFSCIVIVADVVKQDDTVIWKRIGLVDHSYASFEVEKSRGIAYTEAYSEEDRVRYGGQPELTKVGSPAWNKWTGKNWEEELYRRRVNYTFPYYQDETHIQWLADCHFVFHRREYDAVVELCYKENN